MTSSWLQPHEQMAQHQKSISSFVTAGGLTRNTFATLFGQALLTLLVFFSVPYITAMLGPSCYGVVMCFMVYVEAFNVLNLGINASLIKHVSALLPRGLTSEIAKYVGTASMVFLTGALVIAAGTVSAASLIVDHFLSVPADIRDSVILSVWLASAAFVFRFLGQGLAGIPIAVQRFDITTAISVVTETLRIAGTVTVLALGYSLPAVLTVTCLIALITLLVHLVVARSLIPGLPLRPRFSNKHFRSLFNFSKYLVAGPVSTRLLATADAFLIGYFLPVSHLTFYGVPYNLGQKLSTAAGNVASVVFPAASTLMAQDDRRKLASLYLSGIKAVTAISSLPSALLFLFSYDFLLYWLGPEFAGQASTPMRILILAFLLNSIAHLPYVFLQGTGHLATAARYSIAVTILCSTLFGVLIPTLGIIGAAAALLLTQFLSLPWLLHLSNRVAHVSWSQLARDIHGPIALSLAGSCAVAIASRPWVHSLPTLLAAFTLSGLTYAALGWKLVLRDNERSLLLALMCNELGRNRRRATHKAVQSESTPSRCGRDSAC